MVIYQNSQTLEGYIFLILQHFATKLGNYCDLVCNEIVHYLFKQDLPVGVGARVGVDDGVGGGGGGGGGGVLDGAKLAGS